MGITVWICLSEIKGVKLPNNKPQGLQRLMSLKRKMLQNQQIRDDYVHFMEKIFDNGYAEPVPAEDLDKDDGHIWYIPHHGVCHPRKPNKIRVVFDCSAKYLGVSLNDQLLQGPDLTNSLFGVLIRFRQERIGIMGDIESMFFQVKVSKKDTDYLRFLWWSDGNLDLEPVPYRMVVHLFGAVSSPSCSNFALKRTAEDNQGDFSPIVVDNVKRNMYVDDMLASTRTEYEAIALIAGASSLCSRGGFRLTKWVSSSCRVLESVPNEERAKEVKELDLECESLPAERALGVYWDIETDGFGFRIQLKDQPATRRGILSIVSSLYDPLGLVAPFVLNAKILLQDLCRREMGWDDAISDADSKQWFEWMAELPYLEDLYVNRCYTPDEFGKVTSCQIHHFSGASDKGYGTVSYLRLTNENGDVHCSFVIGKARVAPLKKITIPRLELTAATVAVRLNQTLMSELDYDIHKTFFWTDSTSVLRYVANKSTRFHTFVANRLAVIRDASSLDQWRYVESKSNPANCVSRGLPVRKFLQNDQWLQGPSFLWKEESEWPKCAESLNILPEDDVEVKKIVNAAVSIEPSQAAMNRFVTYFSDWTRLRKAAGWILLAVENLRKREAWRKQLTEQVKLKESDSSRQKQLIEQEVNRVLLYLTAEAQKGAKGINLPVYMMQRAEAALIKFAQQQGFPEEFQALKTGAQSCTLKMSSALYKLNPVLVDGLIRVGGRLQRVDIPYEAKHPVVLPKESHVSRMILDHMHRVVGHLGKNSILSLLRQKYWMIGAASVIKSLVRRCVTCRKYQAPCAEQQMTNLPSSRLTPDNPPFTKTGMDYFGPFYVKRGRSTVKRYGVIFTCLTIRAVHLEVAATMDTNSCINAIRRFTARRGTVKYLLSDNGSNLIGAERELREEIQKWNASKIQQTLLQEGISWEFNPPTASHFGGIWERMIRSVRKILYSLMHEQTIKLDDEGLYTLFCEVERILNGRPLTDSPNIPDDLEVITPNHLLLLRAGEYFPPGTFEKTDVYTRRRWRQVQYLANVFWARWVKEYLPLLQLIQKWIQPRRNITIDDIVLVMDNSPRNSWSLGRVISVTKDGRGLVRSVEVKPKTSILRRPIAKLGVILEGDLN